METIFKLSARLVVTLAVCANGVFAQAQTQAPSKLAGDCPEMAEATARLEVQEKRLKDWPESRALSGCQCKGGGSGEERTARGVHGRLYHGRVGPAPFRRIFSGEALYR